jgi:hypothetical protein
MFLKCRICEISGDDKLRGNPAAGVKRAPQCDCIQSRSAVEEYGNRTDEMGSPVRIVE